MWLYIPKTTSASTPVEADSIEDSDSRIQMLARSFTWNESFKQPRSWSTILKRASWSLRLFGLIPEPSIANRLLAEWIGSLEDSRVSRGVSQEPEQEPAMNAGSGLTSRDWFSRYDPEASSWKTSQASFMEELNTFSEGWPRSGSMRNGFLYERPTLVRPTAGSESSSWPTVRTTDMVSGRGAIPDGRTFYRPSKEYAAGRKVGQANLSDVTEMWASASAHDGRRPGSDATSTQGGNLKRDAEEWQTPNTTQHAYRRQVGQTERAEMLLPGQAENWLTPSANEDAAGTIDGNMQDMLSHQAQEATGVMLTNDTGRRLNYRFVEWLMGLPDQWMDFHALLDSESSGTE